MREIEIKAKVKDLDRIQRQLEAQGCVLSHSIFQHDIVYAKKGSVSEWENAKEGDITIRIRYLKNGAELNCKQQRSNEMDNIEYETRVQDPGAMHNILLLLGYAPQIEVKKTRREGKLGTYEICLDEVESLGTYVELETLTDDDADPEKVREELFKALATLGISPADEETRGYDTQIYQRLHKRKKIVWKYSRQKI